MDGKLEIWDVEKQKQVRVFTGHRSRVSSCVWSGSLIASGSKDKKILVRDFRSPCQYEYMLEKHTQEVCGLRWSPHDDKMLASGGNDNKLMLREAIPGMHQIENIAAKCAGRYFCRPYDILSAGRDL